MRFVSLSFFCEHTHISTHAVSFSLTLKSTSVFHLLVLTFFSLAYFWLGWLSKQEMGMQSTADRIKKTSLACVWMCVCVVANNFFSNRRCVLWWRKRFYTTTKQLRNIYSAPNNCSRQHRDKWNKFEIEARTIFQLFQSEDNSHCNQPQQKKVKLFDWEIFHTCLLPGLLYIWAPDLFSTSAFGFWHMLMFFFLLGMCLTFCKKLHNGLSNMF